MEKEDFNVMKAESAYAAIKGKDEGKLERDKRSLENFRKFCRTTAREKIQKQIQESIKNNHYYSCFNLSTKIYVDYSDVKEVFKTEIVDYLRDLGYHVTRFEADCFSSDFATFKITFDWTSEDDDGDEDEDDEREEYDALASLLSKLLEI